jgi:hypothetical protein
LNTSAKTKNPSTGKKQPTIMALNRYEPIMAPKIQPAITTVPCSYELFT